MVRDYNTPQRFDIPFKLGMGMIGCYCDAEGFPEWARKEARRARDEFLANCSCTKTAEEAIPAAQQGSGVGKRAVNFNHVMHVDANVLAGAQDYNNCTAWATRKAAGCAIITELLATGRISEYKARPGTAGIYSYRGHASDSGMAIYLGGEAINVHGVGYELNYDGVADLRDENADERYGVNWGRSGPPSEFKRAVAEDLIEQVSEVTDETAIKDIMYAGHFIITGSTITSSATGDPVSSAAGVGGHAQAMIGMDDTDEFREWYRQTTGKTLNDWVGIFNQSWPLGACTKVSNWPRDLWGPMPYGAFVLPGKVVMRMVDTQYGSALAVSRRKAYPALDLKPWKEVLGWL